MALAVDYLVVLGDEPGLEGGEEQRGGDATEDAADHEDPVLGRVFGDAAENVADAVGDAGPLAAPGDNNSSVSKTSPTLDWDWD